MVTFTDAVTFHLNGDEIHGFHVPPAHTDGDSVVHFRKANVIHVGDLFFNGMYPFIDLSTGGSVAGMIAAADRMLAMAGESTRIIPGHGPLATKADLKAYRDMLATVLGPRGRAGEGGQDPRAGHGGRAHRGPRREMGPGLPEAGGVRLRSSTRTRSAQPAADRVSAGGGRGRRRTA